MKGHHLRGACQTYARLRVFLPDSLCRVQCMVCELQILLVGFLSSRNNFLPTSWQAQIDLLTWLTSAQLWRISEDMSHGNRACPCSHNHSTKRYTSFKLQSLLYAVSYCMMQPAMHSRITEPMFRYVARALLNQAFYPYRFSGSGQHGRHWAGHADTTGGASAAVSREAERAGQTAAQER